MIVGLGIDVASIERVRAAIERHGERLVVRLLTEVERAQIAERSDRAQAVASKFAAKEALIKALGAPDAMSWHEIQVLREPFAPPRVELSGRAAEHASRLGVGRTFVSIAHDAGVAVAVVVLESLP